MIVKLIRDDTRGGALVEFTVTVPLFLSLMFGLVQAGLLLFTQSGLQHGVESAARCASVNYSVILLNNAAPTANAITQSCFGAAVAPGSVTGTTIKQYAAQHSWGIVPPSSNFTVGCPNSTTTGCNNSTTKCGTDPGYLVSVSQTINFLVSQTFTVKSCFPINVS